MQVIYKKNSLKSTPSCGLIGLGSSQNCVFFMSSLASNSITWSRKINWYRQVYITGVCASSFGYHVRPKHQPFKITSLNLRVFRCVSYADKSGVRSRPHKGALTSQEFSLKNLGKFFKCEPTLRQAYSLGKSTMFVRTAATAVKKI